MPIRYVVASVVLLVLAGMLSVAVNSANPDRGAFAAVNKLVQLESALEMYRSEKGGIPQNDDSSEIISHMARVYGEDTVKSQLLNKIDRAELLTMLLSQNTWPIEHENEEVFYDFDKRYLFDHDNDGWLEYRYKDGRLYLIRNGEVCLWNEETDRYQFTQ